MSCAVGVRWVGVVVGCACERGRMRWRRQEEQAEEEERPWVDRVDGSEGLVAGGRSSSAEGERAGDGP